MASKYMYEACPSQKCFSVNTPLFNISFHSGIEKSVDTNYANFTIYKNETDTVREAAVQLFCLVIV